MSFFGSLFGGSNPTLNKDMAQFGQIGGFATNLGEKNLGEGSKFWSDIVKGDASKQSQALAPEIGAAKTSAQQENKTRSEFGSRSGGTTASNVASSDKVHSDITSLIGKLTGTAAGELMTSGGSLLSEGSTNYAKQLEASQQQMENWSNSILGKGITSGVASAESAGLGAAGI